MAGTDGKVQLYTLSFNMADNDHVFIFIPFLKNSPLI